MLNTINVNLNTDLKVSRVPELGIKIKSQDINNNLFILRFTDKGKVIELDETYTVEILTKFEKSKSHRLTSATVYRDYARWEFDTSFITQDEKVVNYVYVRKSGSLVVSADANAFAFDVGLSEIDKDAGRVAEVYDENYEKIIADYSGALDERTTERLDEAVADFNQRGDTILGTAEANELDRVTKESDRQTKETERLSAENLRLTGETDRASSETTRKTNETTRTNNENARKSAETIRLASELDRIDAENIRKEFYEGFETTLDKKADKTELNELSSLLGWHTAKDVVGLEVDFENRVFTRLSGAVGLSAGSDFDKLRAFGGRRRCILSDSGEVLAYHGDANYIEDGSLGQVMVEQPKFYYKVVPLKIEPIVDGKGHHLRKARYYVSDTKQVGFKVHPAFVRNGKELNKIYLSSYEGCLYDVSASAYNLIDDQGGDFTVGSGDKLSSIANAKPVSGLTQGLTRGGARIVAQNRGNGWDISYAATIAATQLLFAIEYGRFNTQNAIGMGVTKSDDATTNMAEPTGATALLGNASGKAENGSETYRGEENFWMNIWKWVDGMNIKPQGLHELYVADHAFADDKGDGSYRNAGITLAKTTGWVSAMAYNEPFDWLFFPSETLGNSAVPVGDHFYQNAASTAAWLAAVFGGDWASGASGGGFVWTVANSSAYRHRTRGARLVYAKGGAE